MSDLVAPPAMTDQEALAYVEQIDAASLRVLDLVRTRSPGAAPELIVNVMAMAIGHLLGAALWPAIPEASRFSELGQMVSVGILREREALAQKEKQSCQGNA